MTDRRTFGQLVRKHRHRQRLTQEALAALAFGNPDRKSYISSVENDRLSGITSQTVRKIAEALSIPRDEIPKTLRWQDNGDTADEASPNLRAFGSLVAGSSTVAGVAPAKPGGLARLSPFLGLAVIVAVVIFNRQILAGLASVWSDIRPDDRFAPLPLLMWSTTLLSLIFFFLGLEGNGATNRADWIARGSWRAAYLGTIVKMLGWVDRLLLAKRNSNAAGSLPSGPNWTISLYERLLALAVTYPVFLWMCQWAFTGEEQRLGIIRAWPADPDTLRRMLICLGFSVTIPVALYAARFERRLVRHGLCLLGLAVNFFTYVHVWSTYGGVLPGPGAINMVSVAFTLGIGFRLFDTVAVPAASAALAGTILSFVFVPLVEFSELITGRDGAGYRDFTVNIVHTIINHSLNIVLFFGCVYTLAKFINRRTIDTNPPLALAIYVAVSLGTAILMLVSATQQFWMAYYLLLGLIPLLNGVFDFLSVGLTRYMLRRGIEKFGWRTIAYSLLDLVLACLLFVALVLSAVGLVALLNWAAGNSAIPLWLDHARCASDAGEVLPPFAEATGQDTRTLCEHLVLPAILDNPADYAWLLAMFLSTLIPTAMHMALALYALGPVLLATRVRHVVAGWSRASNEDLLQRAAASLSLGLWLAMVCTITLLIGERAVWLLAGEIGLLKTIAAILAY